MLRNVFVYIRQTLHILADACWTQLLELLLPPSSDALGVTERGGSRVQQRHVQLIGQLPEHMLYHSVTVRTVSWQGPEQTPQIADLQARRQKPSAVL